MKKIIPAIFSILIVLSLFSSVNTQSLQLRSGEIFKFGNYNCSAKMGYNATSKEVTIIAYQKPYVNTSIGLGLLILKINESVAPDFQGVKATINGQPAKDMLKNYSILEGEFLYRHHDENGTQMEKIISCVYLEVYFFIFENHTIINEQPIPHLIEPEAEYYPSSQETKEMIGENVKVQIGNFNNTQQSQDDYMPFLLIAVIVPSVIVCIVLLPIYRRRAS